MLRTIHRPEESGRGAGIFSEKKGAQRGALFDGIVSAQASAAKAWVVICSTLPVPEILRHFGATASPVADQSP